MSSTATQGRAASVRPSGARRLTSAIGATLLGLTLIVLVAAPASAAVAAFGPPTKYPLSSFPYQVAEGDLDGDGDADLAVATHNGVSVLMNNGGSLSPATDYHGGGTATSIAVGNFDLDGDLDVAVTLLTGSVAVLLNDGLGGLGAPASYPITSGPRAIATGDFDRNGSLDLATANFDSDTVSVLSNTGGVFEPATHYSVAGVTGIAVADFDSDGWPDIVATNVFWGQVSMLRNSSGSFSLGGYALPGGMPLALAVGDFDADGSPDVVVAHESGELSVLRHDLTQMHQQFLGGQLTGVAAGDLNGDGYADVAVSDVDSGSVTVLEGSGTGSLGPPLRYSSGGGDSSVTIAHVDADGRLDLAVAQLNGVAILLNATGDPAPVASVTPAFIDFGNQVVQTTSTARPVTVENAGTAPLVISGTEIVGHQADFAIEATTCGTQVAPGDNCTLSIVFTPTATGSRFAALSITDNANGSPHHVNLSGTGAAAPAPAVQLSSASLSFGTQTAGTTSDPQVVTVTNTGGAMLAVSAVTTSGAHAEDFSVSATTCLSGEFPPGSSCTISVTFRPTGAGARTATLNIAHNAPGTPHTVSLSGTGVIHADIGVSIGASPNPVRTTTNLTYTVSVANHGPSPASGVVLTDNLPSGSRFVTHSAPGATCAVPAQGATGTLTCTFASLPVGTATVTIVVKVVAPGGTTVANTASVQSSSNDTNQANNSATVQTAVFGRK